MIDSGSQPPTWPPALSDTPEEFEVKTRVEGKRIDAYLTSRYGDYSRAVIQKIIDADAVLVNGRVVKASYRVRPGDMVKIFLPDLPETTPQPEEIPLEVIYEDESITVVNKPANMVTHPARGNWKGTLVNALQFHYDNLSTLAGENRPGIVHRLDRDTTGLLVVCKDEQAHRKLALQFELREVHKEYLALVAGVPQRHSDYIEEPIGFHPVNRQKMAIRIPADGGKTASTYYEVRERFRNFALVACHPRTGRTHQIRIHLTHIGHAIVADKMYSGRDRLVLRDVISAEQQRVWNGPDALDTVLIERQALHAHKLQFRHPLTGVELDLTAPLPVDFERTLGALRKYQPTKA